MSIVENLKDRLAARRVELEHELEVDLPAVERLQAQVVSTRDAIARLEQRRDRLAAWGDRKLEIPNPQGRLPELGDYYLIDVEPLRSVKTGKQLAKEEQAQIDELEASVRDCEREIGRMLGRRRRSLTSDWKA